MGNDSVRNNVVNNAKPPAQRLGPSANTANDGTNAALSPFNAAHIYVGMVTRVGVGYYDAEVRVGRAPLIMCNILASMSNVTFGVCDCALPVEGSGVLVHVPDPGAQLGTILGVLPAAAVTPINKGPVNFTHTWDMEPAAGVRTEAAYETPHADKRNPHTLHAGEGRPIDTFPGDAAWINEMGVGLSIFRLMSVLRGSDKAQIMVSLLDDMVRCISGHYQHFNAQGEEQIYNDGGLCTKEVTAAPYQWEKSGFKQLGSPATTNSGGGKYLKVAKECARLPEAPDMIPHRRLHMLSGYLGDLINIFVSSPDPDTADPRTYTQEAKDTGVFHAHLDNTGKLIVKSASGISFQRQGRISVPKKLKEPWDPKGDDMQAHTPANKPAVEWPSDHPFARNLLLRDAYAYLGNKAAYLRLHEQSAAGGGKDWYLPEEAETPTLDKFADPYTETPEPYEEHEAFWNIEPDGSIIVRDAWGSTIEMRGGNIIFNAASEVQVRSGKSVVVLAGHDVVVKGRKSVDITATDNDVRVKANVNLHMVSEGRAAAGTPGAGGGILLESKSATDVASFDGKQGEAVLSSGIILKAKDTRVFMQAKRVHMSGSEAILIEGYGEDGVNNGQLTIATRTCYANFKDYMFLTAGTDAAIYMAPSIFVAAAPATYLLSEGAVELTRGATARVPFDYADLRNNPYADFQPQIENVYEILQDRTNWLTPYQPDVREDIQFTYRTGEQYGTDRASEVYQATEFEIQQPVWAFMLSAGAKTLGSNTLESWQEYAIDETYAWPGEVQYDGGEGYVKLAEEKNVTSSTGVAKSRGDITQALGALTNHNMNEYEVLAT